MQRHAGDGGKKKKKKRTSSQVVAASRQNSTRCNRKKKKQPPQEETDRERGRARERHYRSVPLYNVAVLRKKRRGGGGRESMASKKQISGKKAQYMGNRASVWISHWRASFPSSWWSIDISTGLVIIRNSNNRYSVDDGSWIGVRRIIPLGKGKEKKTPASLPMLASSYA